MFAILVVGLLVIIALTVLRNSANHKAANERRAAKNERRDQEWARSKAELREALANRRERKRAQGAAASGQAKL